MLHHCLAALFKKTMKKMLRLTITLLHILGKKQRGERKISNLSKLMIFTRYRNETEFHYILDSKALNIKLSRCSKAKKIHNMKFE